MPFLPTSSTPSRKTRPPKSSPIYSCLTPSWLQQILDTVDMQQPQSPLEEKSLQEKRNSYVAQQSIKILHIFMSGSLRTSIVPFATFLPQANPFLLCWSVTTQRFSRCSKEKAKSLQLFSAVRPSCIGTQLREWTRWSLLKQSRIQTTWSANIKTGHVVAIVARNNMKNKNMDDLWCLYFQWNCRGVICFKFEGWIFYTAGLARIAKGRYLHIKLCCLKMRAGTITPKVIPNAHLPKSPSSNSMETCWKPKIEM